MSYASDMKKELTMIEITRDREFLSELSALIKMNGMLNIANGRLSLSFQTENASIARRMYSLIKFFYNVHINISVRKKLKLKKNNVYICRLDQNVIEILKVLYILDENFPMRIDIADELINSEEKKRAYLRGAFLAGGSVNNPRTSSYHMEIFSHYKEHNKELNDLLNSFNLNSRTLERKKGFIVYIKESEKIAEFINLVGAYQALFQFEDERIVRDINNSVNRMQNCDMANMNKTVNASAKQVEDINVIEERLGLDNIDDKLRIVAEARLKYPEYPLKEIAEMIEDGKLSKSGLNHRFRKIAKIAKELRDGTYQAK